MYSLCHCICIFKLATSYGQRIICYRPTFAFSQAANLAKTFSEMHFYGVKYYNQLTTVSKILNI